MPISNKITRLEISVGIILFVFSAYLLWGMASNSDAKTLKIHTYTDCNFAPTLRLLSVPEQGKTYGTYYSHVNPSAYGCSEILTISSMLITSVSYRGERRTNQSLEVKPGNVLPTTYYFHYIMQRGSLPKFEIDDALVSKDNYTDLTLDVEHFETRLRGWSDEIMESVRRSKHREETRVTFSVYGDFDVLSTTPDDPRISTKNRRVHSLDDSLDLKEYAFNLKGNGSSIELRIAPLNHGSITTLLSGIYFLILSVAIGLIIDAMRRMWNT